MMFANRAGPEERKWLSIFLMGILLILILAYAAGRSRDTLIYWPMSNEQKSQSYYEKAMEAKTVDMKRVFLQRAVELDTHNEIAAKALDKIKIKRDRRYPHR